MEAVKMPAIGFSVQVALDDKRTIVAQTHADQDATPEEINALLDKIGAGIDRQEAKYRLPQLQRELAKHDDGYARMLDDMDRIERKAADAWEKRGKKGAFQLTPAEEQQKVQAKANQKQWDKIREQLVQEIADCEAKIGGKAKTVLRDVA